MQVFLDDFTIYMEAINHLHLLEKCFHRCQEVRINLNLKKFSFRVWFWILLRHIGCKEGLLMNPHKIEAIQQANHPYNTKELLSFLGMKTFYQRYIKDCAIKTKPLRHLLQRTCSFQWTTSCESTVPEL
jgi:hypothetical protein